MVWNGSSNNSIRNTAWCYMDAHYISSVTIFILFLIFLCHYHLYDISTCRQSLQQLRNAEWRLSERSTKIDCNEYVNSIFCCGTAHQSMVETNITRITFQIACALDGCNKVSAASRLSSLILIYQACNFVSYWLLKKYLSKIDPVLRNHRNCIICISINRHFRLDSWKGWKQTYIRIN